MHTSKDMPRRSLPSIAKALLLGVLCTGVSAIPLNYALALDENALPNGGVVVGGSASFDYSQANQLHINQTSDRAVINWDSFNIGQNALTEFHQNSSSSLAVNRVTSNGVDPTQILGSLKANGRVIVLDRNGVIFGKDSRVDVGGIIASTGTIDDAAFMSGNSHIQLDQATDGQIIMNGEMTVSEAGLAAFVAPTVVNNGVIVAKLGSVQLGAASSATIDLYGDGLMEVAVDQDSLKTMAENNGIIQAQGGKVLITAASAKQIVNSTVNMSGIVNVSSFTEKGGKIILTGDQTNVSGTLDASGHTGGGKILVGGEYQGSGTTAHAKNTVITKNAILKANTTGTSGNGGEVIAWADGNTLFEGKIEAKGGSTSGDGGLVETSGKKNLGVTGSVDASAANGKAGEWLLDPSNVSIRATGGNNISTSGGTVNPASDTYYVSDSSIEAALNLGNNVTITTTNGSGTEAGNIDFDWGGVVINKTSGASATLTLKANGSIDFTNSIITSTGAGNALNVVGWADFDGTGNDGSIAAYGTITTNGGNIYFVGGLDNGANGGIAGDGIGDNYASNGIVLNGTNFNAQGGNIVLNAQHTTTNGLVIQGISTVQTTGNGNITARGIGTTVGSGWAGGVLVQGNSIVRAENGTINITGTNTAATGMGVGVEMNSGGQVYTTGTTGGNINITGTRTGSTSSYAKGIELDGDTTRIYSNKGNITLNGTATTSTSAVEAHGIYILNGGDIYSTGSGTIDLTGTATATTGVSTDIITTGTGSSTIGDAAGTGAINFNANTIDFANTGTLVRTQGSVLFKPRTASTTIGLGGGSGTLNLSDTELGYISAGTLIIGDSAAGAGDVDLDSWNLSGKTHNVEVYGNDIDVGGLTLGAGNFTAHALDAGSDLGNLNISAATTKSVTGNSTITLRADQNVQFYNGSNITATNGSLNVVINADRDADHDGAINVPNLTITTNGGYAVLGGGSGTLWGADGIKGNADDAASTGADNVSTWGNSLNTSGIFITSSTINTGAGDIYLNGMGYSDNSLADLNGIWLNNGKLQTTSGIINLKGTAGVGTVGNGGITLQNSSVVTSATGQINATGTSANISGGYNNYGFNIFSSSKFESTGTGAGAANIILNGYNSSNVGGFGFNDGKVTSIDGDIQLKSYAVTTSKSNVIHLIGAAVIEATGDGNITVETVGGNSGGNSITFIDGGNQRIGSSTMTGDVTLITNDIDNIEATDSIITQGAVYLKTAVASTTIGLGGGTGTFNLGDTELASINAGTKLVIGSLTGTGDIDLDTWNLSSKAYNVEIYGNDIDVGGLTLGSGNFMAHAMDAGSDLGTLNVSAATTKSVTGTSSFTLRADKDINFASGANVTTTNGILNIVLNADRDADQDGAVKLTSSAITTNGGYFVAGGGSGALGGTNGILGDGDGTGADDVASVSSVGVDLQSASITTNAGNIYLTGTTSGIGSYSTGVRTDLSTLTTTSGSINLTGYAKGTGSATYFRGISLYGASYNTSTGTINLNGRSDGSNATARGVDLDTSSININGNGTLNLTANGMTSDFGTTGTVLLGGNAATGLLNFIVNNYAASGSTTIKTTGNVVFKPRTASTTIGLGGAAGTLNLDDTELSQITAGNLIIGDSVAGTGDVAIQTWDLSGKAHNVEIYGNDIDIGGLTLGTGNFTAHALDAGSDLGDLNVSAAITKSVVGTSNLTLRADRNISFASANITTTTGSLNVVLNADRDADQAGDISFVTSNISTNGGYFVGGGGSGILWGADGIKGTSDDAASVGADKVAAVGEGSDASGIYFDDSDIITGAGDIILNGKGGDRGDGRYGYGLSINTGSRLMTTSGAITLVGTGLAGNNQGNIGIVIQGSGSTRIESATGAISLTGTGGSAGNSDGNTGIALYNDARIISTGTGAGASTITLVGTGANGRNDNAGIFDNGIILSDAGAISLTGIGQGSGTGNGGLYLNTSQTGSSSASAGTVTLNATAAGSATDLSIENSTVGGSSYTGNLTLNANTIDLISTNARTTGTILVKPRTASTSIGLAGGTGTLNLTNAELGMFTAGNLIIGDSVNGTGDIDVDSWNLSAKTFSVNLYGNDIDLGGLTFGSGNFTAFAKDNGTDYGTLTVSAPFTKSISGASTMTLNADKDVIFNSGSNLTTTTGTTNLIINSDVNSTLDGGITITSSALNTNGGTITLNSNGNTVTQSGTIGGHETINSNNGDVSIGVLNGNTAGTRDLIVNTGTGTFSTTDIIGGTNKLRDITISADNIALGANLGGTRTLTLETATSDRNININSGTDNGSTLNLTTAELGFLTEGWAGINIGRSDRDSYIDMGATSWSDPVTFRGDFGINGVLTGTDNASFTTTSFIDMYYDIITAGGAIDFGSGNISMQASSAGIYSNGGAINAFLRYGNGNSLTLDAGSGTVTITNGTPNNGFDSLTINGNDVIFSTAMTDVTNLNITAANSLTLPSITTSAGGSVTATVTGIGNGIITTDTISTGDLTFTANTLNIGANITATGYVLLKPYTASSTIGIGGGAGTFNLTDAELAYFTAGTLAIGDSATGSGHVDIDSWDLSGKAHNVQIYGDTIDLGGLTLGSGDIILYAKNDITVSAASASASTGDLTLLSQGNVAVNAGITNTGTGTRNIFAGWDGTSGLTTPALFDLDDVTLGTPARDITIGSAGSVSSAGTGTSVLLVASGAFDNNATTGSTAISAANGRYLVYSDNPTDTDKNGLTAKSLYNQAYATYKPTALSGASRFIYNYQPTLTLQADDVTGNTAASTTFTYNTTGLINGDLIADALQGTPTYSLGTLTGYTQPITIGAGTTASSMGYALAYAPGGTLTLLTLPVTPPPTPPVVSNPTKATDEQISTAVRLTQSSAKQQESSTSEPITQAEVETKNGPNCLVSDGDGCLIP